MKITLKAARVNAGLSLKEASDKLGVKEKALANYESAKTFPRVTTVKKMEELYHIQYDDIDFRIPDDTV